MPSYDTPEAISVDAHIGAGSLQFAASDRADTVVEVRPANPKRDKDVRAAEQTEVGYVNGVLGIRTKERRMIGPSGSVDVTVALPAGSHVDANGSVTHVISEGRLGQVRVKTSVGDVRLDTTGPLFLSVSHGSIMVDHVEGHAEITTSSGSIRAGLLDGPAVLKNSHGSTTVAAATDELQVSGANGPIDIERAEGSVSATTAHGTLRVADVVRGTVHLETNYGAIDIGVRSGTAAWLDLSSAKGQVRNALTASDSPDETENTVEVHARTRYGNIDVRRTKG
ncbi:DUF4097 family beta strand repeat-containing protein [Streptomyces sp. VRA16 Mangrove soil]|uniref:DUF4097 family beta strand repeat-containing protein n=1 Tax=Streptomyces sp. VRA16 Mangrove soil TaxID=2817434 RepID=UPI001A9DE982|nr:DUF4097 family beta strand repeat-containing protein [Streptomyces sp. VRA16 Mangrove soil]MBO1334111.1 DUF4097 family beta strand repeat protein [Streptomyces sp. VRA16 Mangrove soil]